MMEILEPNKFGKLNKQDLNEFEHMNGFTLPDDYKLFLEKYNGGRPITNRLSQPSTDVNWMYGMHDGPEWANFFAALNIYNGRIPSWYIPIGYDSAGNLFIMSLHADNKGLIAFWDHEKESAEGGHQYFDNLTFIAKSFTEFTHLLAGRL